MEIRDKIMSGMGLEGEASGGFTRSAAYSACGVCLMRRRLRITVFMRSSTEDRKVAESFLSMMRTASPCEGPRPGY